MPRYFFHISDGLEFLDEIGTELVGLVQARAQAIETAGVMLREIASKNWRGDEWRMHVVDEAGSSVLRLRFSASGIEAIGEKLAPSSAPEPEEQDAAELLKAFRSIEDVTIRATLVELIKNVSGVALPHFPNLRLVETQREDLTQAGLQE